MKSIIVSLLMFVAICFSGIPASAQPMLKGSASLENFWGSPGMWILASGLFFSLVMAIVVNKKKRSEISSEE